jgi:hypothetical protein
MANESCIAWLPSTSAAERTNKTKRRLQRKISRTDPFGWPVALNTDCRNDQCCSRRKHQTGSLPDQTGANMPIIWPERRDPITNAAEPEPRAQPYSPTELDVVRELLSASASARLAVGANAAA